MSEVSWKKLAADYETQILVSNSQERQTPGTMSDMLQGSRKSQEMLFIDCFHLFLNMLQHTVREVI